MEVKCDRCGFLYRSGPEIHVCAPLTSDGIYERLMELRSFTQRVLSRRLPDKDFQEMLDMHLSIAIHTLRGAHDKAVKQEKKNGQ